MIFDSEEQKKRVTEIVGNQIVELTMFKAADGVPEIVDLIRALREARVVPPEKQEGIG
jgi:hypothetical protein